MAASACDLGPGLMKRNDKTERLCSEAEGRAGVRFRLERTLPPTAGVNSALRLGDLSETLFVWFCILLDGSFNSIKELAVKSFLRNSVAKIKHCICFSPVFTILPDLYWVASHLPR